MRISSILLALLAVSTWHARPCAAIEQRLAGTVVVDASDFINRHVKGNTLVEARSPDLPWLFNNLGMQLNSDQDLVTQVNVPKEGEYHLFVHSKGQPGSSFRVSINGNPSPAKFGDGSLDWKEGGTFFLRKDVVEIRITGIVPGSLFDALVIAIDPELTEDDVAINEYPSEVNLLKDYEIPPANGVRFGDLDGDKKMDFVVLTPQFSVYAYDNDGTPLWQWDAPSDNADARRKVDCPAAVWDFDQDGKSEVLHWRLIDGKEWLCMSEGATGEIRYRTEWPTSSLPHDYNNLRISIARLHAGYAENVLVYSDTGESQTIVAYGPRLNEIWRHTEKRPKDSLGRAAYLRDIDGDDVDEIFIGEMCLSASGKEIFNNVDKDTAGPVFGARFADLNGDGGLEMIAAQGEAGIAAYHVRDGAQSWKVSAGDARRLEIASVLGNAPSPQIIVGSAGATPGESQVRWYSTTGRQLEVWPPAPINGRGTFVKGDWYGLGKDQIFWSRFHMEESGQGTLFFSEDVYQMFDFMGNGNEQVITLNPGGILRVYGYKSARLHTPHRDAEYMRTSVANRSGE